MKRYLITNEDACPPCFMLERNEGDFIESSDIEKVDLRDDENLDKASELIEKTDTDTPGIPALVEEDDNGDVELLMGLEEVSDKIEQLRGE